MVPLLPKKPHSLAHPIMPTADAILNSKLNIPLKGAAIGNGWMDSKVQYPAYIDYAVKTGLIEENSEVHSYSHFIQNVNSIISPSFAAGLEKGQSSDGFLRCPFGHVEDEPNGHRRLCNRSADAHGGQKSSVCDAFFLSTLNRLLTLLVVQC